MQAQAALRVPSTVVPNESNYFLNPLHPDFKEAKVGDPQNFALDVRLATVQLEDKLLIHMGEKNLNLGGRVLGVAQLYLQIYHQYH